MCRLWRLTSCLSTPRCSFLLLIFTIEAKLPLAHRYDAVGVGAHLLRTHA